MRFVQGEKYEFTQASEYRAVYFENLTRKASGVDYRTHYGEDQTGPGVLDELGEPIKIPFTVSLKSHLGNIGPNH